MDHRLDNGNVSGSHANLLWCPGAWPCSQQKAKAHSVSATYPHTVQKNISACVCVWKSVCPLSFSLCVHIISVSISTSVFHIYEHVHYILYLCVYIICLYMCVSLYINVALSIYVWSLCDIYLCVLIGPYVYYVSLCILYIHSSLHINMCTIHMSLSINAWYIHLSKYLCV